MQRKPILSALLCGVISAGIQFYLIPVCFMRSVPDILWIMLMLLLPAIPAVVLLRHQSPKCVLWSLLAQIVMAVVFARFFGGLMDYQLVDLGRDLFDFIAYGIYAFGWSLGAAALQAITLFIVKIANN